MFPTLLKKLLCVFFFFFSGMFKDMTLSNSINEEFKGYLLNTGKSLEGVDLTVRVLTTGCWPGHNQTLNITVPRIPAAAFDVFKSFFLGKQDSIN